MKCATKSCLFPATCGDLCRVCARMLQAARLFQQAPGYCGPNERDSHAKYNRQWKAAKKLTQREKSVVQSAL